jgi:lipopolysaccharide export system ATP-binding protein
MYKRAQRGIGYLPQEASVFRKLTVEDNIKAILEVSGQNEGGAGAPSWKNCSTSSACNTCAPTWAMCSAVANGAVPRSPVHLATDPRFILLDEPFAGVDPIAVEDIQGIVSKLKEKNIGILITDHNVQETLSITDRAYLLFEGKILKQGTAEELAADETVRRVYLGKNFELRRKV